MISNIHDKLDFNPDWEVDNPPLADVFDQSFTYLSSGGQAYAFVSEDGKTVLKFFKHHLRRPTLFVQWVPLPKKWREKRNIHIEKRTKKLLRDFSSYKLSMEHLQEETGLLYVHLNKTTALNKEARIIDKLGIQHRVNLDQVGFVLQKKADLAFSRLLQLVQLNDLSGAQRSIDAICDLILSRCQKGIYDEDPRIHRNFGFVDEKAIIIDVGRLRPDKTRINPVVQKDDLYRITKRLRLYLKDISPQLANYLEETLEKKTNE